MKFGKKSGRSDPARALFMPPTELNSSQNKDKRKLCFLCQTSCNILARIPSFPRFNSYTLIMRERTTPYISHRCSSPHQSVFVIDFSIMVNYGPLQRVEIG